MLSIFFFLLFPFFLSAQDSIRLKSGRIPFSSAVTRSLVNGKKRVGLALSSSENVVLDLEPNNELVTADYLEIEILVSGQKNVVRRGKDIRVCWYKGQVVGDPESRVVASDCDGFTSIIQKGNGKTFRARAVGVNDVTVYPAEDEVTPPVGTCIVVEDNTEDDTEDDTEHTATLERRRLTQPRRKQGRRILADGLVDESMHTSHESALFQDFDHHHHHHHRRMLDFSATQNVVEIAIFSDYRYLLFAGGTFGLDLATVAERNIEILNGVQATYEAANFSKPTTVRLKAQYFFSGGDPYQITPVVGNDVDAQTLLSTFKNWAAPLSPTYDALHLMTGHTFNTAAIGLAFKAQACTTLNAGLSSASFPVLSVINIMAHELGHTLGMSHDGTGNPCVSTGFLMGPFSNTCPPGICPMSRCSIAAKDNFTEPVSCLNTDNAASCADGLWNNKETGVDCGGPACPSCPPSCTINKSGCQDVCTPVGDSFVCSCSDPTMYIDSTGTTCVADVNQCASSPCEETCTNTLGPGDSFFCSCALPKYLSLFDRRTCHLPTCSDKIKNQDETLIDCGGACGRSCTCLISSTTFQGADDQNFNFSLNGAKWRGVDGSSPERFAVLREGVAVRFLYRAGTDWIYGLDTTQTFELGSIADPGLVPPSSSGWSMNDGVRWIDGITITFTPCSQVASTCGNAILEGEEECESCLVYSGGQCLKRNPCCDTSCLAPALRGTACTVDGLDGGCWDGSCITRQASCSLVTGLACAGPSCWIGTGGQDCGVIESAPYDATACSTTLFCYHDCLKISFPSRLGTPKATVTRGFPCSVANSAGVYPSVCNGGTDGVGWDSQCVSVASLSTSAPTRRPTTLKPTRRPTQAPITRKPTLRPTSRPTRDPTRRPSRRPSRAPTSRPTRTARPTRVPTLRPSRRPSHAPTLRPSRRPSRFPTSRPTRGATTSRPTRAPTLRPSSRPTRFPTLRPTRSGGAPTRRPTRFPTTRPTRLVPTTPSARPTAVPTSGPSTLIPTKSPTTHSPTSVPTLIPSKSPTTHSPTTLIPSKSPTTQSPTNSPTLNPTTQSPTNSPTLSG